jgi:hypothetical protein
MVENDENYEEIYIDSKFLRVLLIIATVFLLFAGPTYIPYLLSNILNLGSFVSVVVGAVLFATGLLLMVFLVRKKIIS